MGISSSTPTQRARDLQDLHRSDGTAVSGGNVSNTTGSAAVVDTLAKPVRPAVFGWTPDWSARWTFDTKQDGIETFSRKVQDSPLVEIRVGVEIGASYADVLAVLKNVAGMSSWMDHIGKSRVVVPPTGIECNETGVTFSHFHVDVPSIFYQDRDFVLKTAIRERDGHTEIISEQPSYHAKLVAESSKIVRMKEYRCAWRLRALSSGRTSVEYMVFADGNFSSILSGMVNSQTKSSTRATLSGLIKRLGA